MPGTGGDSSRGYPSGTPVTVQDSSIASRGSRRKGRAPIGPKVGSAKVAAAAAAAAAAPEAATKDAEVSHVWWHDLKEDDPITLEPLATLDVPPFGLQSEGTTHYFDAVALASYITRRAVFQNPLNRKPVSREDCVRLDLHIEKFVPCSRNFRVADALDLQHAIRNKIANASDRSAATLRREASVALHGFFNFPSLQAADSLSAARVDGGWAVVDDDMQRQIEAETIAAMHAAAAAEAARPGGPVPEASSTNFPELREEALLASERLTAAVMEGDGYARAAQAMADEAAREAQRRAMEEEARRSAAREAAARRDAAMRAAKKNALQLQQQREVLEAEAAARLAERQAEVRRKAEEEKADKLRANVVELTAAAEKKQAEERAAACRRVEEEKVQAEEESAERMERQEEERQKAERLKKEKEAEKKRRQKEKKKLEKERVAAEQAKLEMEAAKRAASLRCAMCGEGILEGRFFELMEQKFCSTACVKKKRAAA